MPGLVPGIHGSAIAVRKLRVDGRVKPGHDDLRNATYSAANSSRTLSPGWLSASATVPLCRNDDETFFSGFGSLGNDTTSPPPEYNFETQPEERSRRPLWDLKHPEDPDWKYE